MTHGTKAVRAGSISSAVPAAPFHPRMPRAPGTARSRLAQIVLSLGARRHSRALRASPVGAAGDEASLAPFADRARDAGRRPTGPPEHRAFASSSTVSTVVATGARRGLAQRRRGRAIRRKRLRTTSRPRPRRTPSRAQQGRGARDGLVVRSSSGTPQGTGRASRRRRTPARAPPPRRATAKA